MSIGTVSPNLFDRLALSFGRAFKARPPSPGQLYPPQQNMGMGYHPISFPGWDKVEQGPEDERRVRKALQSVSVFANMQAIANEFSTAELVIKERTGDKLEDVANHPLELLWESPNPFMGRSFLMSFWIWSYTLPGKAYLYWLPQGGKIAEVWPIPPFMIKAVPGEGDFIRGYAFKARPADEPIFISPEYITYSHTVNMFDIRDSLSFLVAAMADINAEIAETLWNQNFFAESNGVPDGLIAVPKDTSAPDLATIRMEVRDFFGGTRRGVAVARTGDMKWEPFGRSQKDVEFKEGLILSANRIGRAMGFPEGYWSETANRANAEQARKTMISSAVWPPLVRLAEDMNAKGQGVVHRWFGNQFRAEFKDIRPEDRELKMKEGEYRKTHWTLDELREADGKDPIGDVRGAMLVAEITKGTPIPTSAPSEDMEAVLAEKEAEAAEIAAEQAPLLEEMPIEATPLDAETPPFEEAPMKAADLDRWERKAIKALQRGKSAAVRFESAAIPLDAQERIREALMSAQDTAAVKAAFTAPADDVDALIDDELLGALDWAQKAGEE